MHSDCAITFIMHLILPPPIKTHWHVIEGRDYGMSRMSTCIWGNFGKEVEVETGWRVVPVSRVRRIFRASEAAALGNRHKSSLWQHGYPGIAISCKLTCSCVYVIHKVKSFPLVSFCIHQPPFFPLLHSVQPHLRFAQWTRSSSRRLLHQQLTRVCTSITTDN
jgi:hypothetical protein